MKNKMLLINILFMFIFGLVTVGCSDNEGILTLNDIPARFNGMYVFLTDDENLIGAIDYDISASGGSGAKISNGSAKIPMWINKNGNIERYKGNDTIFFEIFVYDSPNKSSIYKAEIEFASIVFKNGSATVSVNDGSLYE